MQWMEIISTLVLILFIIAIFPVARNMVRNNSKGTLSDWVGFIIPVVVVVLFIMLLTRFV